MAKLIMMRGLPRSGKSTWVKDFVEKSGNAVVVSRDDLRLMLHKGKWTPRNEGITMDAQKAIVRELLKKTQVVIVDDTNLGDFHEARWKGIAKECGASFEIKDMEFPGLSELLRRDSLSENPRGKSVILQMALQYGYVHSSPDSIIICDLDGTLCNIEHRKHFVRETPKDWKSFNAGCINDTLREDVDSMLKAYLEAGKIIYFVSGRDSFYRKETEDWMKKNGWYSVFDEGAGPKQYFALIMREKSGQDTDIKQEILDKYFKKESIHKVIDDRPSVIRMWKLNGLEVEDVGDGIEF